MAQTTAQVSQACSKIEVSFDNCVTFTDISGVSQSIEGLEQKRMSGEADTCDGDYALITTGKREPIEATVNIVYTETDAEGYEIVREQFELNGCNVPLCLRYTPRGGEEGYEQLTINGKLIGFTYPMSDASSGDPITASFVVKGGYISTTIKAS